MKPWTPHHRDCARSAAFRLCADRMERGLYATPFFRIAGSSFDLKSEGAFRRALAGAGLTTREIASEVLWVRACAEGRVAETVVESWRVRFADGLAEDPPTREAAIARAKEWMGARVMRVTVTRRRIRRATGEAR